MRLPRCDAQRRAVLHHAPTRTRLRLLKGRGHQRTTQGYARIRSITQATSACPTQVCIYLISTSEVAQALLDEQCFAVVRELRGTLLFLLLPECPSALRRLEWATYSRSASGGLTALVVSSMSQSSLSSDMMIGEGQPNTWSITPDAWRHRATSSWSNDRRWIMASSSSPPPPLHTGKPRAGALDTLTGR